MQKNERLQQLNRHIFQIEPSLKQCLQQMGRHEHSITLIESVYDHRHCALYDSNCMPVVSRPQSWIRSKL